MSRTMKSLHLFALGAGLLATIALIFNLVFFTLLYPVTTKFLDLDPSLESMGVVAGLNIFIGALFHLCSVIALLAFLIIHKQVRVINISAIALGIISGIMTLGDLALLSDIGDQHAAGLGSSGEWTVLFVSYGLRTLTLILSLWGLIINLMQTRDPDQEIIKDEVLFFSLLSTGAFSGWLGLAGVIAALFSRLSLWMMKRIIPTLGTIIMAPFLVLLVVWIFRSRLTNVKPGLDEKQYQDMAVSGLKTLIITLLVTLIYFVFQLSPIARESWNILWLPLLIFLALAIFSSLALHYLKRME